MKTQPKYRAVWVIWDNISGDPGYYLRTSDQSGHELDERIDALEGLPRDASDAELKSIALLRLMPPDGLTDQEFEELRESIEVRR